MKKQIIYSNLIPRLFATTIDLFLLSFLLTPVMEFISSKLFLFIFHDFFVNNHIDPATASIPLVTRSREFAEYVTPKHFLTYMLTLLLLNGIFVATFFIGFWKKASATPGKMLMKIKIVDAETLGKPTLLQLIKRFMAYPSGLLGVFLIIFTCRKQAMHDKIAGTVVIKT